MTANPRTASRRRLLAASGSIALLGVAGCLGDDGDENGDDGNGGESGDDENGHDDDHGHGDLEIETFDVIDRDADEVIADLHGDHWHGDPLYVPAGDSLTVEAHVEDADGNEIELGDDAEYALNATVDDGADEIVALEPHGDHLEITGEETGFTDLVFKLWHDDHADWEAPELETEVVEEFDPADNYDDHDDHDEHDEHDGHDDDHDH